MRDDIQRLVESLRSPGLESELRGESLAVDAIASTMSAKDASMTNRFSKKARVASFIAAGIIGFGGVAAAGPAMIDQFDGTPDEAEPVTIEDSSPDGTVVSTIPTTTEMIDQDDIEVDDAEEGNEENDAEWDDENDQDVDGESEGDAETHDADVRSDDGVLIDDLDTAFDETKCAKGNHGKTVSSVARSDGRTSQDVVDAAHSTCGKKTDADEPGDTEGDTGDGEDVDGAEDVDADLNDGAEGDAPEPEQDRRNGNGNSGNANGNGNSGNGNGNSGNGNSGNGNSGNGNGNGRGGK